MAELGPIQSIPWGLGNLLGLKGDMGIVDRWSNGVSPSIDILQWIGDSNAKEAIQGSNGATAVGTLLNTGLRVPGGESWFVRGSSARSQTLAAEFIRYTPVIVDAVGGGVRAIGPECASSVSGAVGVGFCPGYQSKPEVLYPGDALAIVVQEITTAASISVSWYASIYRFRN